MMWKNRVFSGLGSAIEWFDFALYGFFGPIFAKIFFVPDLQPQWLSLISTYGIFAAGYAARPIGAVIFGHLGDKYGRLYSLRITPLLIMITSVLMAIIPTYQTAGGISVLILIMTRIAQGILLGGEFAGNIVYLCESTNHWQYFWGSIGSCTGSFGILLASITASLFYQSFSQQFMYQYGWRIAFLLAIPLGIISFIMRMKMAESNSFKKQKNSASPVLVTLLHHKKIILSGLGLIYLHAASFYFLFIFIPLFLKETGRLSEIVSLVHNTTFLIIHLMFIPFFGVLVNFIGGLKSNVYASLLFALLTIPLLNLVCHGHDMQIKVCLLILSVLTALNAAILPGLLAELIPSNIRYTALALIFNIGFGLFGGSMPFIGLVLTKGSKSLIYSSYYLFLISLITFTTSILLLRFKKDVEVGKI